MFSMSTEPKIRVLVAKPGLDGHDRGAKVIARALRDAGMEVIYTGLRQTPEMVVSASLQEDVQVIGLSIISGAHNAIVPRVMDLLKQNKMDDVLVLVGGIIPDQDIEGLKKIGVAAIFQPGTSMDNIVKLIREHVNPQSEPAVYVLRRDRRPGCPGERSSPGFGLIHPCNQDRSGAAPQRTAEGGGPHASLA